jgi:hypothetical protein
MLLCDLAHLHHKKMGTLPVFQQAVQPVPAPVPAPAETADMPAVSPPPATLGKVSDDPDGDPARTSGNDPDQQDPQGEVGSTHVPLRAQVANDGSLLPMELDFFRAVLCRRVAELEGARSGSTRRAHMGSAGTHSAG